MKKWYEVYYTYFDNMGRRHINTAPLWAFVIMRITNGNIKYFKEDKKK